jgi:hypothetical protein
MRTRAHGTLALALALTFAGAAIALAGPLAGRTYQGGVPSSGTNGEGHRVRTHASGNILLRVAGDSRSVTVRFSSSAPVLYCNTREPIRVQSTHPTSISSSGSFKAAVAERFRPGPGPPAIVQVVYGHFSGGSVHGTIQTRAAECSGVAGFAANAR